MTKKSTKFKIYPFKIVKVDKNKNKQENPEKCGSEKILNRENLEIFSSKKWLLEKKNCILS